MRRWLICAIACCGAAWAGDFQRFELPNGATVLYQGWRAPAGPFMRMPRLSQSGNAIRRIVTADNGAILVAFDVQVDVLPNHGGFRIQFAPVAAMPFFAKAPDPRDVQAGDYVLVDVLEQPGTGKRTFDSIKVGSRDTPMTLLPLPPDVPQPVDAASSLTLDRPELLDEHAVPIDNTTKRVCGKHVQIMASSGGGRPVRFTLSTEPAPGFRLEAIVYSQKPRAMLAFTDGELIYYVTAASAILPQTGPALLWVRKDGGDPPARHVPSAPGIDARQPAGWPPQMSPLPSAVARRPPGQLFVAVY